MLINTKIEKEFKRKRECKFCAEHIEEISYKDEKRLRKFITDRGKIIPRRTSGNCAWHQRQLTVAIKRARELALIPYTSEQSR